MLIAPDLQPLLAGKTLVVLVWLAAFFILERLFPASPWRPLSLGRCRRLSRNGVFWLVNSSISPLLVLPMTLLAADNAISWRPSGWAGAPGLVLDIVLLDFWIYWWHKATHEIPLLWRFHQVHHLDEQLDTTTAVRFHFGEVLLSALVRGAFIVLVDVPLLSVLVFEALILIATVFHHSNLKLPPNLERLLSRLIITPGIHWVHHHAVSADTNSNYGTVFSFWDRLFRSRSATKRTADMPLGVSHHAEQPLPRLVILPFLPANSRLRA